MGGLLGLAAGRVLHGEFVVAGKGGATTTKLEQSGTVTAASSTSLTVKSTDGFVATWTLGSSTRVLAFAALGTKATTADLKTGQQVVVLGDATSSTTGTAGTVRVQPTAAQLKALGKNGPRGFGPRGGWRGPNAPTPTPTPTTGA